MNFTDEQIKDMLELKERTLQKIEKYEKEIRLLEKQIIILDSIVKQSSFSKASSLPQSGSDAGRGTKEESEEETAKAESVSSSAPPPQQQQQYNESEQVDTNPTATTSTAAQQTSTTTTIPVTLTGPNSDRIVANAHITPNEITIKMEDMLDFDINTPPFKTFFLDRIIGEMKKQDQTQHPPNNSINQPIIDYTINKTDSFIREIIIKNYKQKERIDEIVRTLGWSLTKMLENTSR